MRPATEEMDLLGCFGVEPQLREADVDWLYNESTYSIDVDGLTVSFVVEPAYCRIALDVHRSGRRLFAFSGRWVVNMMVIDEPGVDAIEVTVDAHSWLRVQLRPAFEVTQGFDPDAESGAVADGGA